MVARGLLRGHRMEFRAGAWVYSDTHEPTAGYPRPCGYCQLPDRDDGHDACLGELPGVKNACCGHVDTSDAYVQFDDGSSVNGGAGISCWVTLGIEPTNDIVEIRKAYRRRARETHPDHGGDQASFVTVQRALDEAMRQAGGA